MYDTFLSYFLLCHYMWIFHIIYQADADDREILEIATDSCRYEIHTSSLSWEEALQACKHRGMTLVSLSNTVEAKSVYDLIETGDSIYSQYDFSLKDRSYWIGLHMESSQDGISEFHWGDCSVDGMATNVFSDLTDYSSATGCGFLTQSSVLMTTCLSSMSKCLGFICEGVNSCFTTHSTTFLPLGFSSEVTANSRDCALSCLSDRTCAGVHVSSGTSCTMLTYSADLHNSLQESDFVSSHFHHKRLLYQGSYSSFITGLNEDELCTITVWTPPSSIVTTTVSEEPSVEDIAPTPTFVTTGDNLSESMQTAEESPATDTVVGTATIYHVDTSVTTEEFDVETIQNSFYTTTEEFDGETIQNSFYTTTEEFDGETIQNSFYTTTEEFDGETIQNSFYTTTEEFDGETIQNSFYTTTEEFDGETIQNSFYTTIEEFDGETIQNSFYTTIEEFDGETIQNSFYTTTEEFDGETIANSFHTTTKDVDGETISNTSYVNSDVMTEETVTSDFGGTTKKKTSKHDNTIVNEEATTTKELITEGMMSPTTETNIYNTNETTTNECVTNLTISDFLNTTIHHTTSNSDIYSEFKTTTVTDIETQNNESVIVHHLSCWVCVCRDINDTLEERIERIKSGLKLEKKTLSSARYKRISADDPRPTAKYVGVLGIFIMCAFAVVIIGMDILRILQTCDKKRKRNIIHTREKPSFA